MRIGLVILALAGQGAAGFFVFQGEQGAAKARLGLVTLDLEIDRVQALLGELRVAQAGLVANGQDHAFWAGKVAALVQDAAVALQRVDRTALTPEAAQDVNAAAEALAAFDRASSRAKDLLASDQPLTASSLVFGEAAQVLAGGSHSLARVRPRQAASIDSEAERVRRHEVAALGGAAGVTLLVLLLLLPRGQTTGTSSAELPASALGLGLALNTSPAPGSNAPSRTSLDFDLARPEAAMPAESPPEPPRESQAQILADLERESQIRLSTAAEVDLQETASVCSGMARVKDASELPALLARVAGVIDASGIVVWMVGSGGNELRPASSHGYSDRTMAKMKALATTGENAVSSAFRTGKMEVVPGGHGRNGAVVAPITTADGRVGAMAAEIRHGAEASANVQALATIVAAQLAALVAETTTAP